MITSDNSKRIAKNTVFLFVRMLLIMGVTLYTSRVVLRVLGVEDFGIYNVVGGLASSFVFFSSSLSNATQRFLNFELGRGNIINVRNIFNISLLIYSVIALIVFVVSEIGGMWFINHKLVIPVERLGAAIWAFQMMVISLIVTLIGVVFDSVLIARENMKLYAYMGILEAGGKLLIVYVLDYMPLDKLKLYSILLLCVALTIKIIPAVFCIRKYPECRIRLYWDISLFKEMFKFVGWNGFGTAVWAVNEQGMTILLNIFFGPVVNAAKAIATQVNAAVNNFGSNFFVAVRPQIVKSYANKEYAYFVELIHDSSRYSFYLMWLLCLPVLLRVDYILELWLGIVPGYTSEFARWILIYSLVNILTNPFWSAIQAIGKLRRYILVGSTIYLMAFPISYLFLRCGSCPVVVFQILALVRLAYLFITIKIVGCYVSIPMLRYIRQVVVPIMKVTVVSLIVMIPLNFYFEEDFLSFFIVSALSVMVSLLVIVFGGITSKERSMIIFKIGQFLYANRKIKK